MSPLVLGVDSSTQSCKVEIRTADGELVAAATAPHPPTMPPISEQPAESWWDALVQATRTALEQLPPPWRSTDVAAIAIAAQCHGLVLLGADDNVLRPVKLWNDTTSSPQVNRLRERIGRDQWIDQVGSLPTAAFTVGKAAWVAEHEPEVIAAANAILLPHDWLTFRLTGRQVTDRSDASGTGYFDSADNVYADDILALATGGRSRPRPPTVLSADEAAGTLRPDAAEQLGLRAGAVVAPGGGDQHLSAVGLGVRPGEVVYSIGTSGVVYTVSDHPIRDQSGMVDGVADATGRWLPLCSTLNAAKVADTVAGWLDVDHHELGRLADLADPDPQRPVLAAFLDGERKPDLPLAAGLLSGLTSATGREALALAGIEGIVLGLVNARDALTAAGVQQADHVVAAGGGARLRTTLQVLADFDGRRTFRTEVVEPVARGACAQAAAVLLGREVAGVSACWRPERVPAAEPRADRSVDLIMERYRALADWRGADRR